MIGNESDNMGVWTKHNAAVLIPLHPTSITIQGLFGQGRNFPLKVKCHPTSLYISKRWAGNVLGTDLQSPWNTLRRTESVQPLLATGKDDYLVRVLVIFLCYVIYFPKNDSEQLWGSLSELHSEFCRAYTFDFFLHPSWSHPTFPGRLRYKNLTSYK